MSLLRIASAILFIFLCSLSVISHGELAGHIIIAKGSVTALDTEGKTRTLKRRSPFYSGDTIVTGNKSQAQLRFVDKALMTIKANSQLNISNYRYAQNNDKNNKVLMKLVKGGFRTITGQVGKGDKSAYKINTPAASIGIRGTNFEVQQESGDTFVMAVYSGGISVENDAGTLALGLGADFNYVRVSPTSSPKGLLAPPASIGSTSVSEDDEDSDESGDANNDSENSDSEEESTDEEGDSDSKEQTAETDSQNSEEQSATSSTEGSDLADVSSSPDTIGNALDQTLTEEVTQSVAEDEEIIELLATLGGIDNLDELTDFLNSGNTVPDTNSLLDFDDPYANINTITSQIPEHLTDKEYSLLDSGKLMAVALPAPYDSSTLTLEGGPVRIESPDQISMSFSPSFTQATINFHYETVGNPDGVDFQVIVGSDWGGSDIVDAINQYLLENPEGISIPFQAVMVPFDSDGDNIDDAYKLGFEQICSSVCTDPITELNIQDVASNSPQAERDELIALLGGLDGENDESRARLENELVIADATWSEKNDGLILVMDEQDNESENGGTEIVTTPLADIVVTNTTELQSCDTTTQTCTIKVEKVDGLSNVSWGAWLADPDSPITIVDLADGETNQETQFMAFWVAAEPANINQLTGTANFSASDVCSDFSNCVGFTDDGIVQNFSGNFDVDFNSGAITNGNINFESGPMGGTAQNTWNVNFSGQMATDSAGTRQPGFQTESLNGTVSSASGTTLTNSVIGNIGGLFVKPGDNFVGGYNVTGIMSDGNHKKASGLFKLDKQ